MFFGAYMPRPIMFIAYGQDVLTFGSSMDTKIDADVRNKYQMLMLSIQEI